MTHDHQPDPEFVSHLEWQVRTSLRREQRFAQPVQSRSGRRMQIATLVLISALFGAGGVVVKDQVQEARQQELLLAEVEGDLRLAQMEMEIVQSQYQQVVERYNQNLVTQDAFLSAQMALTDAELRIRKLQLDEEEIQTTGTAPRNDLAAPLVDDRDLVTERLVLERDRAMEELNLAQAQLTRIQDLYEAGMVEQARVMDAMVPVQQVEARIQELEDRMDLRQQVLDGDIAGQEAERRVELTQLRGEMDVLQRRWESASLQLDRTQERVSRGLIQESQLQEARLQLMQLETRMEIVRMKLEILEEGTEGPATTG